MFLRYLVSSFLVLLLPLTFIAVVNLRFLRREMTDYVMRETEVRFSQIVNGIENEYNQLFAMSAQLLSNSQLTSLSRNPSFPNVDAARNMLSSYVLANDFVREIFLYDRRSEKILTSRAYVDFDFFFTKIYRLGGVSPQQIRTTITQLDRNTYVGFGSVTTVMEQLPAAGAYITSSTLVGSFNSDLSLGYILNRAVIDELAMGHSASASRQYVLSEQDVLVYHADARWKETYPHVLSLLVGESPRGSLRIEEEQYFYFVTRSKLTQLQYVYLVPRSVHLAGLYRTLLFFVLSLVFCGAVGSMLVVAISSYNYRPIKRLLGSAGPSSPVYRDEISAVEHMIRSAQEDNEQLSATVEKSRDAVADQIVGLLLKNEIDKGSELLEFFEEHGIPRTCCYRVIAAKPESPIDVSPVTLMAMFTDRMPASVRVFGIESIVSKYLIFALFYVSPPSPEIERDIDDGVRGFQADTAAEYGLDTTVGIGRVYSRHSDVATSYREAVACLDYAMVRGPGATIYAEEVEANGDAYSAELVAKIGRLLAAGACGEFLALLDDVEETIRGGRFSLPLVRMTVYDVIAKTQGFLLTGNTTPSTRRRLFAHLEAIGSLESVDAAFSEVRTVLRDLEASSSAASREKRVELMLAYIENHGTDPGFSATHVAEAFGMERANFSRYFKRHTGSTFVDYVSTLRIELARKLLVTTDLSLNEIVRRVGYSDASAFIRKFRKHIGVTPATYRTNRRNVTA